MPVIGAKALLDDAKRSPQQLLRFASPTEPFWVYTKLAMYGALLVASPFIFWEVWRFVAPALYKREKRMALVVTLVLIHMWLPGGRRRLGEIAPGVIVTLVLWLAMGEMFGRYLANFAYTYVTTYAGLASAMIALVFLYWTASIFLYGGELNAAIMRKRAQT